MVWECPHPLQVGVDSVARGILYPAGIEQGVGADPDAVSILGVRWHRPDEYQLMAASRGAPVGGVLRVRGGLPHCQHQARESLPRDRDGLAGRQGEFEHLARLVLGPRGWPTGDGDRGQQWGAEVPTRWRTPAA